jgi:CHASE3 domain sensor protein
MSSIDIFLILFIVLFVAMPILIWQQREINRSCNEQNKRSKER